MLIGNTQLIADPPDDSQSMGELSAPRWMGQCAKGGSFFWNPGDCCSRPVSDTGNFPRGSLAGRTDPKAGNLKRNRRRKRKSDWNSWLSHCKKPSPLKYEYNTNMNSRIKVRLLRPGQGGRGGKIFTKKADSGIESAWKSVGSSGGPRKAQEAKEAKEAQESKEAQEAQEAKDRKRPRTVTDNASPHRP